ncbi:hypothetical protein F511_07393 [Dorcoceras hygrometricum]|uniref:Uncharacterized protein n=1 Tax=Dorcoceras hygrometricum TaxID=472368 RepID=A0A2Z7BB54_9LAMI|nr:hypothetical protein F511_07393 [Dorcoceras hygrometricum]
MGRRGAGKKEKNVVSGPRASMTLREEATGRRQRNVSARTMCIIEHLRNLALWAATEASIPSLGAFFGQRNAVEADKMLDAVAFPITETPSVEPSSPSTPLLTKGLSLLDAKMRKRNRRSAKQVAEREGSSTAAAAAEKSICKSSKRRRKSWTSLKEIAQNAENDTIKKFAILTIPFFM